jgi:hypothetical protein
MKWLEHIIKHKTSHTSFKPEDWKTFNIFIIHRMKMHFGTKWMVSSNRMAYKVSQNSKFVSFFSQNRFI